MDSKRDQMEILKYGWEKLKIKTQHINIYAPITFLRVKFIVGNTSMLKMEKSMYKKPNIISQ